MSLPIAGAAAAVGGEESAESSEMREVLPFRACIGTGAAGAPAGGALSGIGLSGAAAGSAPDGGTGLRRIVADSPPSAAAGLSVGAAIGLMLIGRMPEDGTEGAAAESGAPAGVIGLMVIGLMSMESPGLTVQRSIGLTGQTVGGAFSIQHCRVAA